MRGHPNPLGTASRPHRRGPRALRWLPWLLWLLWLLPAAALAQGGPTKTCVEIANGGADAEALERLVRSEIDRHTTHRAATSDCTSYVRIERLDIGAASYLTGRINTSVPHREAIVEDNIARAVERMLRVLLNNDPKRLRGPRRLDAIRRQLSALKAGRMVYGVEAFQLLALVDGSSQSVAGVAINVRREVDAWQLGGRIHYAGRLGAGGADLTLVGHLAVQLQVAWFTHPHSDTSLYFGALAGLDHQRYDGPSGVDGGPSSTSASLFGLGGRLGVEFFRATASRVDLFAQVVAPTGSSTDEDDLVIDAWVPSATMGLGVAF